MKDLSEILEMMQYFHYGLLGTDDSTEVDSRNPIEDLLNREIRDTSFEVDKIQPGLTKTPFLWECEGKTLNMQIVAGFTGTKLTEEGYLTPEVGWAVG